MMTVRIAINDAVAMMSLYVTCSMIALPVDITSVAQF